MTKLLVLFLAISIAAGSLPANAQPCGPRREVIDRFKTAHGERESWYGHVDGNTVALLLTGKNGSWTLLLVRPDVACGIASGAESTPLFGDPA